MDIAAISIKAVGFPVNEKTKAAYWIFIQDEFRNNAPLSFKEAPLRAARLKAALEKA